MNNTDILAVSVDPPVNIDPESGQDKGQIAFAASLGVEFPMLPDTGRNVTVLYEDLQPDTLSGRMSVLIDKDGIVRLIDRNVQVRSHGPDILKKMKELQLDKPYSATAAVAEAEPIEIEPVEAVPAEPVEVEPVEDEPAEDEAVEEVEAQEVPAVE